MKYGSSGEPYCEQVSSEIYCLVSFYGWEEERGVFIFISVIISHFRVEKKRALTVELGMGPTFYNKLTGSHSSIYYCVINNHINLINYLPYLSPNPRALQLLANSNSHCVLVSCLGSN